ncbi:MAG: hypothetical protein M3464_00155 [Chloroflexota bacterium]|nr:hypothetical protein [Chloroflexota bacterium]
MNVSEGLQQIKSRLEDRDANPQTLALVGQIMRRAALPAAQPAAAQSLLQLVRMLSRTPIAHSNVDIYNDLVGLEEDLSSAAIAFKARQEAEDAKPVPKTKKFYKERKEREGKQP